MLRGRTGLLRGSAVSPSILSPTPPYPSKPPASLLPQLLRTFYCACPAPPFLPLNLLSTPITAPHASSTCTQPHCLPSSLPPLRVSSPSTRASRRCRRRRRRPPCSCCFPYWRRWSPSLATSPSPPKAALVATPTSSSAASVCSLRARPHPLSVGPLSTLRPPPRRRPRSSRAAFSWLHCSSWLSRLGPVPVSSTPPWRGTYICWGGGWLLRHVPPCAFVGGGGGLLHVQPHPALPLRGPTPPILPLPYAL